MNWHWVFLGIAALLVAGGAWLFHVGKQAQQVEWGHGLLNSLDGLTRLLSRKFHRLEFDEITLPEGDGAIVASNHHSGLDPLLLISAIRRPLRFMIAREQYDRPWLRWVYKSMGCIPVDRSGAPDKAFYSALKALERGELIGVFPEGRITPPGESVPLKRGVVLLADMAKVPIIPVRLSGISGAGRVITAIFMRSEARLEAGPPIWVDGPRDLDALNTLKTFFEGSAAENGPSAGTAD